MCLVLYTFLWARFIDIYLYESVWYYRREVRFDLEKSSNPLRRVIYFICTYMCGSSHEQTV